MAEGILCRTFSPGILSLTLPGASPQAGIGARFQRFLCDCLSTLERLCEGLECKPGICWSREGSAVEVEAVVEPVIEGMTESFVAWSWLQCYDAPVFHTNCAG